MFAKAVVQAWLGAAVANRVPEASVCGGSRQPPRSLPEGDPPGTRRVLLECVGSVPMRRVARSSRIDKRQVVAYREEPLFRPWAERIFFVLGHPPDAPSSPPFSHAADYLRCMALADVAAHIDRTGRGTVNSELLDRLGREPSVAGPHSTAMTFDEMLDLVDLSRPIPPTGPEDESARVTHALWGFAWMGRPMPLCVDVPA